MLPSVNCRRNQHGHGTVNIAVEGTDLWIELEAPGADIVGFEHEASSEEDKAAVARAEKQLSDPLTLFSFARGGGLQPCGIRGQARRVGRGGVP